MHDYLIRYAGEISKHLTLLVVNPTMYNTHTHRKSTLPEPTTDAAAIAVVRHRQSPFPAAPSRDEYYMCRVGGGGEQRGAA